MYFTLVANDSSFLINAIIHIDGILQGHGLGVLDVDRLALGQSLVVFIRHFLRAFFGAHPAANAFGHVHVPGLGFQGGSEMARLPADLSQFGEGVDLDVAVPADLGQLGGDDSHSAVVGGKGLVQLGHDPTDTGALFRQVDVIA